MADAKGTDQKKRPLPKRGQSSELAGELQARWNIYMPTDRETATFDYGVPAELFSVGHVPRVGKRATCHGQYRHGERTKAAIAERHKFSALLKMLRAGLT